MHCVPGDWVASSTRAAMSLSKRAAQYRCGSAVPHTHDAAGRPSSVARSQSPGLQHVAKPNISAYGASGGDGAGKPLRSPFCCQARLHLADCGVSRHSSQRTPGILRLQHSEQGIACCLRRGSAVDHALQGVQMCTQRLPGAELLEQEHSQRRPCGYACG